jgi:hypothetical protein
LKLAAGGKTLILALDDFTKGDVALPEAHLQKYLIPELLFPLAAGYLSHIKMILIMTNQEYFTIYRIVKSILNGFYADIELKDIPAKEFESLAKEYLRSFPLEIDPYEMAILISWYKKNNLKEQPWPPARLKKLYQFMIDNGE